MGDGEGWWQGGFLYIEGYRIICLWMAVSKTNCIQKLWVNCLIFTKKHFFYKNRFTFMNILIVF